MSCYSSHVHFQSRVCKAPLEQVKEKLQNCMKRCRAKRQVLGRGKCTERLPLRGVCQGVEGLRAQLSTSAIVREAYRLSGGGIADLDEKSIRHLGTAGGEPSLA